MTPNKLLKSIRQYRYNHNILYDYTEMGYTYDSFFTDKLGIYHVVVKYKGKTIYNEISDNYTVGWIIEDHIKQNSK